MCTTVFLCPQACYLNCHPFSCNGSCTTSECVHCFTQQCDDGLTIMYTIMCTQTIERKKGADQLCREERESVDPVK